MLSLKLQNHSFALYVDDPILVLKPIFQPGTETVTPYIPFYFQFYSNGTFVFFQYGGRKFCNRRPGDFVAASNNVTIVFHSDGWEQRSGFFIQWTSERK